ncbi:unnamed protein product [Closterium sp. NIES-54]
MAITGSCAPLAALVPLFLLLLLLVPESARIGGVVRVGHALDASNVVGDMGFERGMSLFRVRAAPCLSLLMQAVAVRGAEAENLAKTRVAQRDIWERQFPPGDCQGQRLLVLPWSTQDMRGVGSGSVIEQTKQYPSWQFHYSTNPRLPHGANDTRAYEFMQDVAVSLASVLIAAECDYFVGSLESNWSRLINELRSTNGRLYAGFIALNIGL